MIRQRPFSGSAPPLLSLPLLLLSALLAPPVAAQEHGGEGPPGVIAGSVHDSIAGAPLPGATVVLLGASRMVETDAEGRFVLSDVAPGTHTLTFFHPRLESLGLGAGGWTLQVTPADTVTVRFAVPSAEGIAERLCGGEPAVLVGFLRDARTGQPVPRGRVVVEWGEGPAETAHSTATEESGRYVFCGLPSQRTLRVHGTFLGVESVEHVVAMGEALALRDVEIDVAAPATVRGRVRSLDTGEPVEGALVRLSGVRRSAVTNAQGRFDLGALGRGRHVLEVEHLAFGTHRDTIDIEEGSGLTLEIEVPTRAVELEGIEVTVEHRYRGHMAGFERRMERGLGSFITRDEIERQDALPLPNLVAANAVGFRLQCTGAGCTVRSSRAARSFQRGSCAPEIWLDGAYMMGGLDLQNLPAWQVEAIEAYDSPATIPPRFRTPNAACGVIVVWTRSGRDG